MKNNLKQNHPAKYEEATAGYNLFDVKTGGELGLGKQVLTIGVFCANIFNTAYFNHLSFINDIGIH